MKTILLHVGTHKTGSTSLQSTFHRYVNQLRDTGVEYLGGPEAYPHLFSAFSTYPMTDDWNVLSGLSEDEILARDEALRRDLDAQIKASSCPYIVISSEYLSLLSHQELSGLKLFLERHGRVIAIYYYRELLSWMSSDSQQLAKVGLRQAPTTYETAIERIYDMPLRVHQVFGSENSRFIRFEDATRQGICNSFLEAFDLPSLTTLGFEEVYANESISANAVHAMYLYNSLFPLTGGSHEWEVAERLRYLKGPKYEIAGLTEEQRSDYAEKRAHISEALGLQLKEPEELPLSPSLDPMADELWAMVNRFMELKGSAVRLNDADATLSEHFFSFSDENVRLRSAIKTKLSPFRRR